MPRGSSDPAAEKDKQIGQRVLGALLSSSFAFATRFSFVKYNIAVKYNEIVSPQVLYPPQHRAASFPRLCSFIVLIPKNTVSRTMSSRRYRPSAQAI
jgi:hypothetical protein